MMWKPKACLSSLLYMLQFCLKLLSQINCLSLNMYLCYWMVVYRLRCMKMWGMAVLERWVTSVVDFKIMKNAFSESSLFNSSWLVRTPMETMLMLFEAENSKCLSKWRGSDLPARCWMLSTFLSSPSSHKFTIRVLQQIFFSLCKRNVCLS